MNQRASAVIIDPVQMNITNRLAHGCKTVGPMALEGGLLLQGEHSGDLTVANGPLVIYENASVTGGFIDVTGDVYVFGRIGSAAAAQPTVLRCTGVLHLTSKAVVFGTLQCAKPALYDGAQMMGVIETQQMVSR